MKYLILIDEKPAGLQDWDGEPHLFFAGARWPAREFSSYEEARKVVRQVKRCRNRQNMNSFGYSIQSIEDGS